jgi:hypothetical protein
VLENRIEVSKLLDELPSGLVTHTLDSRNVIGRIPDQRQIVDHAIRWDAQTLVGVGFVDPMLLDTGRSPAARVEQTHPRPNQLIEILITRHDDDLESSCAPLGGEGTNHIVRLIAIQRNERDSPGCQELPNPLDRSIEVFLQLVIEFLPGGFVGRIDLISEGGAGVIDPGHRFRMVFLKQAMEKIGDAPGRRRILATARREWTANHGKERSIDQRIAID